MVIVKYFKFTVLKYSLAEINADIILGGALPH